MKQPAEPPRVEDAPGGEEMKTAPRTENAREGEEMRNLRTENTPGGGRTGGAPRVKKRPGRRTKTAPHGRGITMSALLCIVMVGFAAVVLAASALIFVPNYERGILQSARTSSDQAVAQVTNTVGNYVSDMGQVMKLLTDTIEDDTVDRDAFFQAFLNSRPDVVAVTAYDADGSLVNCWTLGHTRKTNITKNLSFDLDTARAHPGSFLSAPHVETLFDRYYPWVVTMTARVDGAEEKWIALDLSFSSISSYINGVGIGQHGYCYIVDDEGNLIYHPQQQLIYYGLKTEETAAEAATLADGSYGNDTILYSVKSVSGSAWRIVGVSYVDELVRSSVERMLRQLLGIGALLMGITLAVGSLVSHILSQPLRGLAGAMGSFEKDADHYTYAPVRGSREVHILSESFGHMVVRIQQLMARVRSEEVELRKTELKALQAQINPHFLYNTLDSIAWMCEQGRNAEAVQMVHALATLFRISISKGQELIPISKEIEHAKSYLQIEKYRYKDRFSYHFDVDPACAEFLCNKITLQPIIENAICHGLDMLVDEGCIDITVRQEGGDILFIVKDNGVGMTQQQADSMLNREASDRTGIGIKNVNDRLRIYFGEGYGLHIISELDVGTTVEIRMPKVREGEYETK